MGAESLEVLCDVVPVSSGSGVNETEYVSDMVVEAAQR
jgi:hypothetical protein